jgi:hypothetical protein
VKKKLYKSKNQATCIIEKNLMELDAATFSALIFENSGDPELAKLLYKIVYDLEANIGVHSIILQIIIFEVPKNFIMEKLKK